MQNFLLINIILSVYLLVTAYIKAPKIKLSKGKKTKGVSKNLISVVSVAGSLIVLLAFYFFTEVFLFWYLRVAFSLMAIVGAFWLSGGDKKRFMYLLVAVLGIIIYRFFSANYINHNILMILAIFWLGSFLTYTKIFDAKRILIFSVLWALYDLYFVWLSSSFTHVGAKSTGVGFPLGIVYKNALVGSGDLFWASLLLQIVSNKLKIVYVALFVATNFLVGYILFSTKTVSSLPLLVFWVPIGLTVYYIEKKVLKIK